MKKRQRASPCFYSQREENEERPLKSRRLGASPEKVDDVISNKDMKENITGSKTDSVVSSSGSCNIDSYNPYDTYCGSVHNSNAESACQSGYHEDNDQAFTNETLADEIHRQELNAYRPKYWLVRLLPHQLVDVGTMWKAQKYLCYMWYGKRNYAEQVSFKRNSSSISEIFLTLVFTIRLELAVRMG
ncbi:hypothetical protein Tco_1548753 [Tanacetum coccineum]